MNDLVVPRTSAGESQGSTIASNVYQVCKRCLGGNQDEKGIGVIPLSYVIEKLEYEYDLEVYR